mmetsp:Transcript_12048/g.25908  ORF Transcript_12048/g.25908 Transcript_12048/m.25908 type:complete len:225 (-) Transcript_12048:4215-4889(-)|eukprot:CAMPEP_0203770996 /NCGR_PEP_ID=MMETSP0099_2-20121227/3156_1 /ASSEMBLY_ACC=CAM_ASM_000209 /TAXON_ID=96639 /ORGANISM=" , Strain NY0313808BC1" /LENGTH=224 /DNA_ID=CAMNT_0050668265 /DNA_START=207 /DNA_END=881 /DNA_ORIENTATION=+
MAGFSDRCASMFETVLCMECDPFVGTGNIDKICRNTCDMWYDACKEEFFAAQLEAGEDSLKPCTDDALVCSPLSYILKSGAEMCTEFGLAIGDDLCYDGSVDERLFGEKELTSSGPGGKKSSRWSRPPKPETFWGMLNKIRKSENFALTLFVGLAGVLLLLSLINSLKSPDVDVPSFPGEGHPLGGGLDTGNLSPISSPSSSPRNGKPVSFENDTLPKTDTPLM